MINRRSVELARVRVHGYEAACNGVSRAACPYRHWIDIDRESAEWLCWVAGWDHGKQIKKRERII